MKVTIDGKQHEITKDQLSLDDGYALITPDSVPDGYYKQEAMESKIKERLSKAKENAKSELLEDPQFNKQVLSKYNVQLDSDGKPVGLKPTVDVEEVKRNVAESIKSEYEEKLQAKEQKINQFINKGLNSAIVEGASRIGIDGKYLEPLVEGGSPYLVKEMADNFIYSDEVGDYVLKDKDGTPKIEGDGYLTVDKYFEKNTEKFKPMLKDNRQRGSNFNGQGNAVNGRPKGSPKDWDTSTKLEYIKEHGRDGYKQLVKESRKAKKED